MSSFQQPKNHKAYKEIGMYETFKGKIKATEMVPEIRCDGRFTSQRFL